MIVKFVQLSILGLEINCFKKEYFLCYSLQNASDILGHEAIGKEDVDQKCYKRETNQSWDAWDYLQEFHKYSIE